MPIKFTDAEEATLKRALEYVLSNATFAESIEVLGSEETHLFRKFNISPSVHRNEAPDYVLRMSAKDTAVLGLAMLTAATIAPSLMDELEGIRANIEAQAKARVHDQKEREAFESRTEFASSAQARSFA